MPFTIKQRVKIACAIGHVKLCDIASAMNVTHPTLTKRLENDKFTKEELEKIASVIGCKFYSAFVFEDGKAFSASTNGQQIKDALEHANMTITELAAKMGLSQQAMSKRLVIGKQTQDDLSKIAGYMNCEYVLRFEFEDGTIV